jgi:hypothetical protein
MLLERKSVLRRNKHTPSRASRNDLYEERSVAAALHHSRSINANGLSTWPLHRCKRNREAVRLISRAFTFRHAADATHERPRA